MKCLDNIDYVDGDKYCCRVHDADIYIDNEFWNDDSYNEPVCELISEGSNEV